MSLVSLVKVEKENLVSEGIKRSLDLIEFMFPVKPKKIIIKPNLCYYWDYTTGATTDPGFVGALIEVIRKNTSPDVDISIVESDASAMMCKYAFKMLGYEKLAKDYDVKLVNLSSDESEPIEVKAGQEAFTLNVPKTIKDADLRINIPKIKYTTRKLRITCALKNMYGCNPYPQKFRFHKKVDETIVALNKLMKFELCIIDGIIVSGIRPRRLGLVMSSNDPVAIDAAAAVIAGENPWNIGYLKLAEKEGLGTSSYIAKGEPISYFKNQYPKRDLKTKLMSQAYSLAVKTGLNKRLGL